jgi:hypothetical protein
MGEDRIRLRQPSLRMGKPWRVEIALGLTVVIAVLLVARHLRDATVAPPGIEAITYLEGDQKSPVDEGDPVCLTGVAEAIGKIKRVRTVGRRLQVVMSLGKRYQPKIPADSVTLLRVSWDNRGRCGFFDAQGSTQFGRRMRFLQIDTSVYGRCFDKPNCKLSEAPITEHAVLQASYRLFCGEEEGVSCGGVVEFLPRPWWRRAIDRVVDFAVMDVGVIYIQLFGAIVIVIAGFVALAVFVRRRMRTRAKGLAGLP